MKIKGHGQGEILSNEQINSLFTHGLLTPRDKALFGICLYTAARISEACKVIREDCMYFSIPREKIILRKSNTKGKSSTREIPIHPKLKDLLTDYSLSEPKWQYTSYLFPGRGGMQHINPICMAQRLGESCKKVGLTGVSTHSFRRTCLTAMSNQGVPLRHIQSISGHKSLSALQSYLGVKEEEKFNAINTLSF